MLNQQIIPPAKNNIIELEITAMSNDGIGIGKINSYVMFVPNSAIGDKLLVKVLKTKKSYGYGKIERIIEPSKSRIESDCPICQRCGGCSYRHINYEEELKIKKQKVSDCISRIGNLKYVTVNDTIASKNINNYRNKTIMPLGLDNNGDLMMGFYSKNSHRIVNCDNCKLQNDSFTEISRIFKKWLLDSKQSIYDEQTQQGNIRNLYIRIAEGTDEIILCIVSQQLYLNNEDELISMMTKAVPNIKGIIINQNDKDTNVVLGDKYRTIWGNDYIIDTLSGLKFKLSVPSFYQVNHDQTEVLYNIASQLAEVTPDKTVLDLYCGTGTIGLTMARSAKKIIGIDIVKEAIDNARDNATLNNICNAEFICLDLSKAADVILNKKEKIDVVIIDPPRKGCDAKLISVIGKISPDKVIYISCDPATLARDLKIFDEIGYKTNCAQPVDMFPRTFHVETVTLLSRKAPDARN